MLGILDLSRHSNLSPRAQELDLGSWAGQGRGSDPWPGGPRDRVLEIQNVNLKV